MVICICAGKTDDEIKEMIIEGGCNTMRKLQANHGINVNCRSCEFEVIELLDECKQFSKK